MSEGLNITVREFQILPVKKQNTILFENTEQLKQMVQGYKYQQKIQWAVIFGIAAYLGLTKYILG